MPIPSRHIVEHIFTSSQQLSDPNTPSENTPNQREEGDDEYVLVTGGAGYIGSHTILELLLEGHNVICVDDLSNSCEESLLRVAKLTNRKAQFHKVSICDYTKLSAVFSQYPKISSVIHFAGLKSVTESVTHPLRYYHVNVAGSVTLFQVMLEHGVYNLVFSSSATVYGQPETLPIPETHKFGPINPYGRSKLMVEDIIRDVCTSNPTFNAAILRYFNPVGAHDSGMIGEDPKGVPNNLMPYLAQVLVGKRHLLNVYGSDYDTRDGTGVRDFIHVVDLAKGHLAARTYLVNKLPGCVTYNMGTGTGYSVLEMIRGMEESSGLKIRFEFAPRRPGDVGEVVADPSKARQELDWNAKKSVLDMCRDTWRWQKNNPNGYNLDKDSVERSANELDIATLKSPKVNVNTQLKKHGSPTTLNSPDINSNSDESTVFDSPSESASSTIEKIPTKKMLRNYGGQSLLNLDEMV